jgi:2-dehydro-3-deoxyglucarate aldolase
LNSVLKKKLYDGDRCFGTWITSSSPNVVELLKQMKFDWFVLDTEHSPINVETTSHMMQVLGSGDNAAAALVRIGQNDQYLTKLALDAGATGVVVPMVNTMEEAERAVRYSKYPPRGIRGAAATRASLYGLGFGDYVRKANDQGIVVTQVETREALDNLDEILGVDGLDVAFVGPTDMTMSLGLVDDRSNEKVKEAMRRVVAACKRHGKIPGIMALTPEEVKSALEMDFRFISLASDMRFLGVGARTFLALTDDE